MTEPENDNERTIPLNGRPVAVRKLTDTQMVHALRHARILQKDDVPKTVKLDSVERIFHILHTVVLKEDDQKYLTEQEEAGKIELKDLMAVVTAFGDGAEEEEKPKVRRGRPPRRLQ